jgi:hypothetical protein
MRAVVGCAIVSVLLVVVPGRAEEQVPLPRFGERTCEEQCQAERQRDDAACDDRPLREGSRVLCHDSVRARLEVCLRICED